MKEQQNNKRNTPFVYLFYQKLSLHRLWEFTGAKLRYSSFYRKAMESKHENN